MGYRLTVEKVGGDSPKYYGTKLYGYVNETELESYQWLIEEGLLNANEEYTWGYNFDNPILMRVSEFKTFAELYNKDFNCFIAEPFKNHFIKDKDIQQFLKLNDWELVVISWG